jgi:hypothetical protein
MAKLLALAAALVMAPTALGDGLPVVGVDGGSTGVTAPGESVRYVTLPAGDLTIVARVQGDGGRIFRSMQLPGRFTIPAVAYDGSTSGLSADGSTLVLIRPRTAFPRARTPLAILDARTLQFRGSITLHGDFSFDALSRNGAWLYLIQYVDPTDPTQYRVRAFDVRAARLLPKPVVDPRERGEAMRGSPITRATSPDGRWAYTLYDGVGEHPFVHALDTQARTAHCVELQALAGRRDLYRLRLQASRDELVVSAPKGPVAVIDTKTFRVSDPAHGGGRSWMVGAVAIAVLLAVALGSANRLQRLQVLRRRRPGAGGDVRAHLLRLGRAGDD